MAKNLNFGLDTKKRFTIDGDESRVIEIDTSDFGIVTRYKESMAKIDEFAKKHSDISGDSTLEDVADKLAEMDNGICDIIDFIFGAKVARTILNGASAFSPVGDKYKFEQIILVLLDQCEADIKKSAEKINKAHVTKHTGKYTVR